MDTRCSIELLDKKQHDIREFECGIEQLDIYLKERAGQEVKKNVTVTYILHEKHSPRVLGYYTLSSCSIELRDLAENIARKLPKYETLPVALVGRLAVDRRYRSKRIGESMLLDALDRSYRISKAMGLFAVIVDAKSESARSFYQRYGFVTTEQRPFRLYLPMKAIEKLVG